MENQASDMSVDGERIPKLLFVPGIEHENGDLGHLQEHLCGIADIITIEKESVGFSKDTKNEWECMLLQVLKQVAESENVDGVIGHSFGCFRTLRLLEKGLRVRFSVLLNPPLNAIGSTAPHSQIAPPSLTETHTESRLRPLISDLSDDDYAAFIQRHTHYELKGNGPFRPWHKAEFITLRKEKFFPDLLREIQPDIPIDIMHSSTDPWNIENWGDVGMNIKRHDIPNAGHYLATSHPDKVSAVIRELLEQTICLPKKSVRSAA